MKKILPILALFCYTLSFAQVTQVWADYNSFWTSSATSINPVKPNTAHNLLAFKWNNVNYSTGVNNAKLTANSVVFSPTKFRALPINEVPLTGPNEAYFVGLGALVDGLPTTVDNGATNPFAPITSGTQKATYLTKGAQGLDLGSCLTNIPKGVAPNFTSIRFNLSASGITLSNVGDGVPDILVSQIAQPSANNANVFRFVNAAGATVGNEVNVLLNNTTLFPAVGNWNPDFYNNNSTQTVTTFVNTERPLRFFAVDLSSFGITSANYTQAVALIYAPGGDSDPAFLAFNEPSLGISTQLAVVTQPTSSACDGSMASSFTVRLQDRFGFPVMQAGIEITASMETGPGNLLGTLTALTNASGVSTFSNLSFEVGGDHRIRFSNSSLEAAITANITGAVGCSPNVWTGNGTNNNWNNTANWQTGVIPNANNNVEIPTGRPRYPVLQNNAGAKDLVLGANATINLNGKVFAVNGTIVNSPTAKITASTDNSVLYMSGSTSQTIPSGLILNGDIANLTVENAAGVVNADILKLTQVLLVRTGTFTTGNNVTMVCRFTPTRRTAQIGAIGASANIIGDVTIEQCFPARRAFRFISSSVTTTTTSIRNNWQENASAWNANPNPGYGTHITGIGASGSNPAATDGVNGFDWQPSGASSLFKFSNAAQTWSAVGNTNGNLLAGDPYRILIRGNRSTNIQSNAAVPTNTILRSKGVISKGPVAITGLSSATDGFNLIGNPFQAVVDMALVNSASINIRPFYYVWDPTLGGTPVVGQTGGRGAYVTVNIVTGVKSNQLSEVSRFLQPYQAFFVQTSTLGVPVQMTFEEQHKAVNGGQTNVFRQNNDPDGTANEFVEVTLFSQAAFDTNDTSSDGLRIDFSATGNNEVDIFDAIKFQNSDESMSRKNVESLLSIENRNMPQSGELLPLHITQYRQSDYTMQLNVSTFASNRVYLKDFYLNQQTLLENGAVTPYNVTVADDATGSNSADRFAILFEEPLLAVQTNNASTLKLYPNPVAGDYLYVNASKNYDAATVEVFNVVGQLVTKVNIDFNSSNQGTVPLSDIRSGLYLITITTNSGETLSTKFIKT